MKDFFIFQDGGTRRCTLVVRWTNRPTCSPHDSRPTFSPHDSRPTYSPHYSHASDVSSPRLSSLVSSSSRRRNPPPGACVVCACSAPVSRPVARRLKERLRERGLTERVPLNDLSRGGVERGAQPGEFRQTHRREFVPTFPRAVPRRRRPRGGGAADATNACVASASSRDAGFELASLPSRPSPLSCTLSAYAAP